MFFRFARSIKERVVSFFNIHELQVPGDSWGWLVKAVGPTKDTSIRPWPSRQTAMISLTSFFVCLVVGGGAASYHNKVSIFLAMGIMFTCGVLVATFTLIDMLRGEGQIPRISFNAKLSTSRL
jgi:hypothetical protein